METPESKNKKNTAPGYRKYLTKQTVWDEGENNAAAHRIPGTAVTQNGTVLVFAEARPDGKDETPKSIVMKRSRDGGDTWSGSIYVEKCDGTYWTAHQDRIDKYDIRDKKEVWTNMTPLADRETGRIFLFYALNEGTVNGQNLQRYTKVFYKYSDDDGMTWSNRIEITELLNVTGEGKQAMAADENGFPCDYLGRAFHMPGPGHGIQLSDGRLLLHFWNRAAIGRLNGPPIPVDKRKYGVCTIYSDDHGGTWHYGSGFGHDGQNLNESRILELENGDIYLNGRYKSARSNHRMTAASHDRGQNWEAISVDESFPMSNQCDAGLARLTRESEGKSRILYSKNEYHDERKKLVLRLSICYGTVSQHELIGVWIKVFFPGHPGS